MVELFWGMNSRRMRIISNRGGAVPGNISLKNVLQLNHAIILKEEVDCTVVSSNYDVNIIPHFQFI